MVTWGRVEKEHLFDTLGQTCQFPLAGVVSSEPASAAATTSSVLIARDDESVQGQSALDALLDKVERLTQDWVGNRKVQEEEESEECFLLQVPSGHH